MAHFEDCKFFLRGSCHYGEYNPPAGRVRLAIICIQYYGSVCVLSYAQPRNSRCSCVVYPTKAKFNLTGFDPESAYLNQRASLPILACS